MVTPQPPGSRPHVGRSGLHRLLPAAGIPLVVIALLAHLAGGAALMHLGLGSGLASRGSGSLLPIIAALVSLKLLALFAARRWWRQH